MSRLLDVEPAVLVLEDGRVWRGRAYGAIGEAFGEAVFTTGMSGYQETLTDPSYHGQVVVQTSPHIGNYGVNDDDAESRQIWVAGYVVRDASRLASNWRSERTLDHDLVEQGIVGISDVDTRAITRHLRERGAMRVGAIEPTRAIIAMEPDMAPAGMPNHMKIMPPTTPIATVASWRLNGCSTRKTLLLLTVVMGSLASPAGAGEGSSRAHRVACF